MNGITVGLIEFNTSYLTEVAILSASDNAGIDHNMVLIVNSKNSYQAINQDARRIAGDPVINAKNVGYTKAANQIINRVPGNDVVLLNTDTICHKDWLVSLRDAAYSRKDIKIGMACPRLIETFSRHRARGCAHADSGCRGVHGPGIWYFCGWFGFACAYLRRDMISNIGILKEKYFNYGSDKEYGIRAAAAGYHTAHTHGSIIRHLVQGSQKRNRRWLGQDARLSQRVLSQRQPR